MSFMAFLLATSSAALATENKTDTLHIHTTVKPKVLMRRPPKYPVRAAKNGIEGWVIVSFVVDEDGATSNIIVEDSSNRIFEPNARSAIKSWRYSPAMQDSHAIEHCQNRIQLDFTFGTDTTPAASPRFGKKYKQAMELLKEGKIDEFKLAVEKMGNKERINIYEDTYYRILTFQLASTMGDEQKELSSINSLLNREKVLTQGQYEFYAEKGFALALNLMQYSKSKSIYKQVADVYPDGDFTTTYKPYFDQITNYIASDQPLVLEATIGKRDFWRYDLSRNGFVIDEVQGKLSNLEIRCDYKHSEFLVESGNLWEIPESWGKCAVYVFGDKDTRFTFGEVHSKEVI